jgi:mRNA interferase RelE/StbE
VKRIRFEPAVRGELRAIPQQIALTILEGIHRYAETGTGNVKPLSGEFAGFLRLRVGDYRIFFAETTELITVHRVRNRRDAYR